MHRIHPGVVARKGGGWPAWPAVALALVLACSDHAASGPDAQSGAASNGASPRLEVYAFAPAADHRAPPALTAWASDAASSGGMVPAGTGVAVGNGQLLLAADAAGARLFACRGAESVFLAELRFVTKADGQPAAEPVRLTLRQRSAGKAALEAECGSRRLGFSLKRGSPLVEITPGAREDVLPWETEVAHWVVPGFVGDDYARSAADAAPGETVFIPAEQLLLGFGAGGRAMLFLAWPAGEPLLSASAAAPGLFTRLTVNPEGKRFFLGGALQGGLWRECDVSAAAAGVPLTPDWNVPFDARWQATLVGPDGVSSWEWKDGNPAFKCGPHGFQVSVPWPFRRLRQGNEVQAVLELPPAPVHRGAIRRGLIYPIRRGAATPADVFLPEDLLREAFDTGVCEYVRQREWTGAGEGGPLCVLGSRLGKLNAIYAGHGRPAQYWRKNVEWKRDQGLAQYRRLRDYRAFALEADALCRSVPVEPESPAARLRNDLQADCAAIMESCEAALRLPMETVRTWRDEVPDAAGTPEEALQALAQAYERAMRDTDAEAPARIADLNNKLGYLATAPQTELPRPRRLAQAVRNTASLLAGMSPEAARAAARIRSLAAAALGGKHWAEEGR